VVAVVRSFAAAIRPLMAQSLFNSVGTDRGLARFIPANRNELPIEARSANLFAVTRRLLNPAAPISDETNAAIALGI
jgi:hypothetical protein